MSCQCTYVYLPTSKSVIFIMVKFNLMKRILRCHDREKKVTKHPKTFQFKPQSRVTNSCCLITLEFQLFKKLNHELLQAYDHFLRERYHLNILQSCLTDLTSIDPCVLSEPDHQRIILSDPTKVPKLAQLNIFNDLSKNYFSLL